MWRAKLHRVRVRLRTVERSHKGAQAANAGFGGAAGPGAHDGIVFVVDPQMLLRHLRFSAWHTRVYRVHVAALMQLHRGTFLARTVRVRGVGLSARARARD